MSLTKFVSLIMLITALGVATAEAQSYSASYKFLKAIKDLDYREIKVAVEKGVNVNTRDYDDKATPLVIATRMKQASLVNYLLANGAKPDMHGEDGKAPLVIAATKGERTIVSSLIRAGADINFIDNNGITPLMAAVMSKKTQVVKLLLESGADFDLEDYSGRTALQHAIDHRTKRVQKLLEEAGAVR